MTMQVETQSFEVADGDKFGDLLSVDRASATRPLRIGLFAGGYFEFWRMYPDLRQRVESDARVVLNRLSVNRDIEVVYSGLADTIDAADAAGQQFRNEQIDVLVLAYRTYIPDVYVHRMLSYLPSTPLLLLASQSRDKLDYTDSYEGVLRNSGVMALVQLVAGFRKMGMYETVEVIAGSIHDDDVYRRIDSYLRVISVHRELQRTTIGVIGNVFRGMFDFEFDRTKVKGVLGPEILNIQLDHLVNSWNATDPNGAAVSKYVSDARAFYEIDGVGEADLLAAARLAAALDLVIDRYRIDGLVLLCQHFVEMKLKTSPNFALSEFLRQRAFPGVVEGDVLGLIMMRIMHRLTGKMPFFFEWSEFDVELNAWMLLGHGFGDASQANPKWPPKLTPSSEQWGLEGTGCSTEFVPMPGPCTLAHFIEDTTGWRMVIGIGEYLDCPPLPIRDTHAMVKVEQPIKAYTESLTKAGVPHHAIVVAGDIRQELRQLADLMKVKVAVI